jgi:MFS family permease
MLTFGVITGLGLALGYVTAVVDIAYWFNKRLSMANGLGVCGTGIGTFLIAPLTQALIEYYGWRGTTMLLGELFFPLDLSECSAHSIFSIPSRLKANALQRNAFNVFRAFVLVLKDIGEGVCWFRDIERERMMCYVFAGGVFLQLCICGALMREPVYIIKRRAKNKNKQNAPALIESIEIVPQCRRSLSPVPQKTQLLQHR